MIAPAMLSLSDAHRYLGVARDRVREWVKAGDLEVFVYGPRTKRVKIADLERLGREQRTPEAVDPRAIARRSLR